MIQEVKYQNKQENDSHSSQSEPGTDQIFNRGIWLQEQLLKFMIFAHFNINVFPSRLQRRTNKIFKQMAKFIGTRSATQCRSQNQKLMKKHKNIKKIIDVYETYFGKNEFQRAYLYYYDRLREMQSARKKLRLMRSLQLVSICCQTDFLSDNSSQENEEVKVKKEQEPIQAFVKMQLTDLPIFPLFVLTSQEKQQ